MKQFSNYPLPVAVALKEVLFSRPSTPFGELVIRIDEYENDIYQGVRRYHEDRSNEDHCHHDRIITGRRPSAISLPTLARRIWFLR